MLILLVAAAWIFIPATRPPAWAVAVAALVLVYFGHIPDA